MAISNDELKKAFREVVSQEFSQIPSEESKNDFVFTEQFDKKMERLIASQKKSYWIFVNTASKRIAIFCVLFMIMFTTACSVESIRQPIVKFITEVYEEFIQYLFEGETSDEISHIYQMTDVPEGFEQVEVIRNAVSSTTIYENEQGKTIEICQTITESATHYFDVEKGTVTKTTIGNMDVAFYECNDYIVAIWIQDEYLLQLTYYGATSTDILEQIIMSVK